MKRWKNLIFYAGIIGGFSALIYWIIQLGKNNLEVGREIIDAGAGKSQWTMFANSFGHNFTHPLAILLLQIVTIVVVARLFSWICRKIGQPAVIGEIIAGIVLGPSLVGMYFPEFSGFLFPADSLSNLQFLSQIGLILFMFVVGMELDLKVLRHQADEAVVISHASIIIPFTLGMGLAYFIYGSFAPDGVPFVSFGLFLGISMSITAFPVLARIVQERNMHKSRLGTIVITCAAADDITAWSLLAAVIAIVKAGSFMSSVPTILMAAGYVFVMLKVIRPFLKRVGDLHASRENLSKPVVGIFFLVLLLSSYTTEVIGIHALFGAFMAGAIMPENQKFKQIFIEKVEDVALVLLLPLFFVYTGLRTEIGLLDEPGLWLTCGLVILVAVIGKFAGSALAAKFIGQNWRDSLFIGALMNTRGLVELVALNIGYDLGVMTPEIFAMLVIMALTTTFMTAPALHLIDKFFKKKGTMIPKEIVEMSKFRILISFGKPEMGKALLRLANYLDRSRNGNSVITALHLSPNGLFNKYKIEDYERESFIPLISESQKLNQHIQTMFKVSEDIESDIVETANKGDYDLLLVGIGHSIYQDSMLGKFLGYSRTIFHPEYLVDGVRETKKFLKDSPFAGATGQIVVKSNVPVGILIDRGFQKADKVLLPVLGSGDHAVIEFVRRLIRYAGSQVTVYNRSGESGTAEEIKEALKAIEQYAPDHIVIASGDLMEEDFPEQYDLMLISLESWKKLIDSQSNWMDGAPSMLIVKP
ncbi:MAG: cation:proton antiporter [Prolixibacteraceae bacterium]